MSRRVVGGGCRSSGRAGRIAFGPARRSLGVAVTVWDDAVVRWLAGLRLPGLTGLMEADVVFALARIHLGVDAPTDAILGAVIGVAVSVVAYRLFVPNEIFPVTYKRGRSAHLDASGRRGEAIRQALADQLGLRPRGQPLGWCGGLADHLGALDQCRGRGAGLWSAARPRTADPSSRRTSRPIAILTNSSSPRHPLHSHEPAELICVS
jgi:hypothetical protein